MAGGAAAAGVNRGKVAQALRPALRPVKAALKALRYVRFSLATRLDGEIPAGH